MPWFTVKVPHLKVEYLKVRVEAVGSEFAKGLAGLAVPEEAGYVRWSDVNRADMSTELELPDISVIEGPDEEP